MTIQKLEWDSEFFGRRIGRLHAQCLQTINIEQNHNFDLVYIETECESVCCAPTSHPSWFNAGRKLTFTKNTNEGQADPTIIHLTDKSSQLQELAWLSGHQSRYKLDPNFTNEEFRRLYDRWIDACLEGQWHATILGIQDRGKLTGFVTIESIENDARIGLIAVHPDQQGMGLSGKLIQAAITTAKVKGHRELRVSTQHINEGAIRAYLKNGFQPLHSIQQFHWWPHSIHEE